MIKENEELYEKLRKKYRLTGDYHTHTYFSDGFGSVEKNVQEAIEKGLDEIAITDHAPGHIAYGVNKKIYKEFRDNDLILLRKKYPGIKILWGIEADIIFEDIPRPGKNPKPKYAEVGKIDIREDEYGHFDLLTAGYHYAVISGYTLRNWFTDKGLTTKKFREKQRKRNTNMILDVLKTVPLKILTHPGDKAPVDMTAIAKVCADKNILMEISGRHKHPTVEELKEIKDIPVSFIIGSDAHRVKSIGRYTKAIKRALDAGIEIERIVNVEERKQG